MAGHFLDRVDGVTGAYSLTFDDGPSVTWTPLLLRALAAHGAHATFFPLAHNLRRERAIAAQAIAAGHEYGVHGEWHLPPPALPWSFFARDTQRGIDAATAVGPPPVWYRPPFDVLRGTQAVRMQRELGLIAVRGDVDPADYNQPGEDRIVERVMARLAPGSIVVMHDASGVGDFSRRQSVQAAARILAQAAQRGWRCVSVSELVAMPGARADGGSLAG
jgi:peptidoglycan/xylan/chitin deacetylase (PgdA/CDA1 family)